MTITNFRPRHAPLLVDFVASNSGWIGPGRELGRETFRGLLGQPWLDLADNCFLLVNAGQVKGFSLVFNELPIDRCVIEFATSPGKAGESGASPEKDLLSSAVDRAQAMGAGQVHVCVVPGSPKTGLLEAQGFVKVQTYFDMVWDHQTLEDVPLPAGFRVRHFREGDAALLTAVQNDAFSGSWGFCPNTVEQIDYRTRMANTSNEGILFLYDGDTPAGYCWTAMVPVGDKIRGTIGMVGVVQAYRGKGVSRSILQAGMAYLRSVGVDDIGLEVDGSNAPAVGLYTSTGFEKVGEHHWFELVFRGAAKPER